MNHPANDEVPFRKPVATFTIDIVEAPELGGNQPVLSVKGPVSQHDFLAAACVLFSILKEYDPSAEGKVIGAAFETQLLKILGSTRGDLHKAAIQ